MNVMPIQNIRTEPIFNEHECTRKHAQLQSFSTTSSKMHPFIHRRIYMR